MTDMANKVQIGRVQPLIVARLADNGAFVDAGQYGELFVPQSQLPSGTATGDSLEVFIYESHGRTEATLRRPRLELRQIGLMTVRESHAGTAYLDWGIPKDLILPRSEQKEPRVPGDRVLVMLLDDSCGRLFATERLERYLREYTRRGEFRRGQQVRAVAVTRTPLGIKAAVDDSVSALLYDPHRQADLRVGQRFTAYVTEVRRDMKVSLSLTAPGRAGMEADEAAVLKALEAGGGFLPLHDRSPAEKVTAALGMSKARFKQAAGRLYRRQMVIIGADGLRRAPADAASGSVTEQRTEDAAL